MPWSTTSSEWNMASVFSQVQPITAGTILFRQNDHPQSVALVVDGWVTTVRLERDGRERGVALYTKGSLLGLAELLTRQKYLETSITLSLSRIRWISAKAFSNLVETDLGFFWQIFHALSRQNYASGICLAQRGMTCGENVNCSRRYKIEIWRGCSASPPSASAARLEEWRLKAFSKGAKAG